MKLSVITINLNNLTGLQKTVGSVQSQTCRDFEHIIIDGGSVDGSVDFIQKNRESFSVAISEKDSGLYNAQNKGIRNAKREYLLFLNSGDYLPAPETLDQILSFNPAAAIVYGNMFLESRDGVIPVHQPEKMTLQRLLDFSIWHPASIVKRDLFYRIGFYREDLKIASDHDFFLKAVLQFKVDTCFIPVYFSVFNMEGISSKPENQELVQHEKKTVQSELLSPLILEAAELLKSTATELQLIKNRRVIRWADKIHAVIRRFR